MKKNSLVLIGLVIVAGFVLWGVYPRVQQLKQERLQSNIEKKQAVEDKQDKMDFFMGKGKVAQLTPKKYEPETLIAKDIKHPHGIGVINGVVYVSSETDKTLYKLQNGARVKVTDANFVHTMLAQSDGSIIATVFMENTVISIKPDGTKKVLVKDLAGPNGIVEVKNNRIFISNYLDGTVVSVKKDGSDKKVAISDLKGPAGLAYDSKTDTMYVADYLGASLLVVRNGRSAKVEYPGLTLESIYVKDARVYATTGVKGRGVIVQLLPNGKADVIANTGLPSPLNGHFTDDGSVYVVSPNDPHGYVLKYLYEQ